ncbi:MAG: hypothetical protein JNM17_39170 [Archangium sp.]|nr:hypothetical protein [Archangium sp.]
MLLALTFVLLSAEPTPALKSMQGLNVKSLKPWLIDNLPSLAKCGKPGSANDSDEVTVRAQFSSSPDVKVERVDAALSDVRCVKTEIEKWKNDGHQPRAGPFSFTYRFRPK